jgi:hypothetical protein
MTIVTETHFVRKVTLHDSTPAVHMRMGTIATVTNKRKVLSVEGKDEVIRKIEDGDKKKIKKK